MKKKQKKRAVRGGGETRHLLDTSVLEQQAHASLDAKRWRDAMGDFKELLKRGPRAEWQQGLSDAYAGRASELTAKGMLKEALAIWENRAALDPQVPMHPDHAGLLIQLGQPETVVAALRSGAKLPSAQQDAVRAVLAARVISGDRALSDQLPADDSVRVHAEPALAALHAYCENRDQDVRAALAAIPFRSPYRDWVLLLKALLHLAEAPEEASEAIITQLERVPDRSPFAPIKRAIRLSLLPEQTFNEAASQASLPELQVATALRGWSVERLALWQELTKRGTETPLRERLRLLYRHGKDIDSDWVRRKALTLAFLAKAEARHWLRECGAAPLTEWEKILLLAWDFENDPRSSPSEIMLGWSNCIDFLKKQSSNTPLSRPELRIALMQRRTESLLKLLERHPVGETAKSEELAIAGLLEDSLKSDPEHRETYLKLIDFYRQAGQRKDARRMVELGQQRWPQDLPLLTAAMQIALDSGAFKKATTLAKTVLEADPINSDVRRRLMAAHFSHASKQVGQHRYDLARKELMDAQAWASGDETSAQITLSLLLLNVIENPRDPQAIDSLKGHYAQRPLHLSARVELIICCARLKIPSTDKLRLLGWKKTKGQGRADLQAALGHLRRHADEFRTISKDLSTSLEKTLSAAPWQELERGELEIACDSLHRFKVFKACQQAAEAALKHWPGEPIFVMYRFQAKYPRGFDYQRMADLTQIEDAWHTARERGDTRTTMRIEKVLPHGPPIFGHFPMPPVFFDDAEEDDDDDDLFADPLDPFDDIFNGIGPSLFSNSSMRDALKQIGPIKALEMLGAPKTLIAELKKREQALGSDLILDEVISAIDDLIGDNPFDDLPFPLSGKGSKSKSKRTKPKRF